MSRFGDQGTQGLHDYQRLCSTPSVSLSYMVDAVGYVKVDMFAIYP